jgi:uncharacterized protein (DUF1499 family)
MRIRGISRGLILALLVLLSGCFWASPDGIGLENGHLKSCPESPNCVSSREDGEQQIDPLKVTGSTDKTRERIISFLQDEYEATVLQRSDTYVHVTVSTTLGFVDDLQFRLRPDRDIVHLRSASRVGQSDLGVNRARIQALRKFIDGSE